MRKVVVNTTPLIALSHVDQLNILKKLQQMVEKGIYISQSLIELCLKQVGEAQKILYQFYTNREKIYKDLSTRAFF